jgi:hypothetical protein
MYSKRLGDAEKSFDANIPLAALDAANVVALNATKFGERFLTQLARLPSRTHRAPQFYIDAATRRQSRNFRSPLRASLLLAPSKARIRGELDVANASSANVELARHAGCLFFYPGPPRAHDRCCAVHLEALSTQLR